MDQSRLHFRDKAGTLSHSHTACNNRRTILQDVLVVSTFDNCCHEQDKLPSVSVHLTPCYDATCHTQIQKPTIPNQKL